jgi:hypothetical protein
MKRCFDMGKYYPFPTAQSNNDMFSVLTDTLSPLHGPTMMMNLLIIRM